MHTPYAELCIKECGSMWMIICYFSSHTIETGFWFAERIQLWRLVFVCFFLISPPRLCFSVAEVGKSLTNEVGNYLKRRWFHGLSKNWLLFIFQRVSGLCWLSCLELWEMFISCVLLIFLLTDLRLWAWSLKTFFSIYLDASKHREHCMATGDKGP